MAETPTRTKSEWIALADAALETAIGTVQNTTLVTGSPTASLREAVTRAETLKLLVKRMLRKGTQAGKRSEVLTNPPVTPGA
jgi:hypothetical protein